MVRKTQARPVRVGICRNQYRDAANYGYKRRAKTYPMNGKEEMLENRKNEEPMGEVEMQLRRKGTEKQAEQPMKGGDSRGISVVEISGV